VPLRAQLPFLQITIQLNTVNVASFVAYPLDTSIPDPLENQNTSIGGAFMFGGFQEILFEATITSDDVTGILGAQWSEIWIGPADSDTVPTQTNSQFLILRQNGANIDLPGTSYTPLSNPVDEPIKLLGTATDPSDPDAFRIRFSLIVNGQLLANFNSQGGPNLSPYNNAASFSISGSITVNFVDKKRTLSAVHSSNDNLDPTTTLVIENIALPPLDTSAPTSSQQASHKGSLSAGIIAAIVVTGVVVLVIASVALVLLKRNKGSGGVFGFKGTQSGL